MQFSLSEPILSPSQITHVMLWVHQALIPHAKIFANIARVFFPVIVALEFAKEALNIVQGKQIELVGKMIKYGMVGLLVTSFSGTANYNGTSFNFQVQANLYKIPLEALGTFYKVSAENVKEVKEYREMLVKDESWLLKAGISVAELFAKLNPVNLFTKLLYFISNMLGMVVFLSAFVSFYFIVILGPMAAITLLSDELKFVFVTWVKSIISYSLVFVFIALALDANMSFQVKAIHMAWGETSVGFWETTKATLYMSVLSIGNFYAAVKLGPMIFKAGGSKGQSFLKTGL